MIAFPDFPISYWVLCFLVTLFAGFTKGVTGFALPMIMVSGMASFLPAETAIAAMVVPTLVGNGWQALRQGRKAAVESFRTHWILILSTLIFIFVFAQILGGLEIRVLMMVLGASIVFVSLLQIIGFHLSIRPERRKLGAVITGIIAGFFGSIAGTWGPPTIIYLLAIGTPKKEQVRVCGILFGLGALVFWIAHQRSGIITSETMGLSFVLLIPMFIGLFLGLRAQDKIDQATFRKIILWVLLLAGLNILRKAWLG